MYDNLNQLGLTEWWGKFLEGAATDTYQTLTFGGQGIMIKEGFAHLLQTAAINLPTGQLQIKMVPEHLSVHYLKDGETEWQVMEFAWPDSAHVERIKTYFSAKKTNPFPSERLKEKCLAEGAQEHVQ